MTHSHFIEILTILTKYVFDVGVRSTVTVGSITLRFYCTVEPQNADTIGTFRKCPD